MGATFTTPDAAPTTQMATPTTSNNESELYDKETIKPFEEILAMEVNDGLEYMKK